MNSKPRENIFGVFKKRDLKRFSMFVAIAFVFLIFSKLSNDYKQILTLEVNLTQTAEEVILKQDASHGIDVLVKAKGFALVPYIFNNREPLVLDATKDIDVRATHYFFDVQKNKYLIEGQLGSAYKIVSLSPDTLKLPYSISASKYIPITLNSDIEYAAGFDIKGQFLFNTDSVKIVGAQEKINAINTISTKPLTLSKVNSSIDQTIALETLEDVEVFPKTVNVKADVKRFTEGTIEIPITITSKPNSVTINYFPKTVKISYYVDLERYNSISTNDFKVECNYSDIKDNQTFFVPKLVKSPNFIKRLSLKQKRIDFIKL